MIPKTEQWEERLEAGKDVQESWREYLTEFEDKIMPIMVSHGFSRDAALLVWRLNCIDNVLSDIRDLLREKAT
jgi:hypothetical protein